MSVSATTVAVRGRCSNSAISPTIEPEPIEATYSPFISTLAVPSTTT